MNAGFAVGCLSLTAVLVGCEPALGPCDVDLARTVVYSDDDEGLPAYAGQALLDQNCGANSFCHTEGISASDRFGVPAGLDFDLGLAGTSEQVARLRRTQRRVYEERHAIWSQVVDGTMPPGEEGAKIVALGRPYRNLPGLDSQEGKAILKNWLSCGVPVVERVADDRPTGVQPVGAIVLAMPAGGDACTGGEFLCGGRCVDVLSNVLHCGACGNVCDPGRDCIDGGCATGCAGGLTDCGGTCADTTSDFQNCGACDNQCAAGNVCAASACSTDSCPAGTANCGGSCVDVQASIFHCGGCDLACRAGETCELGACDCGDTSNDPFNCGRCGNVCAADKACAGGACLCAGALTDCGGMCVDTNRSASHCGGCGLSCGAGEECQDGSCATCGAGVSYAAHVQPIFDGSCSSGSMCHSGSRPAADLSLVSGQSYADLVGAASDCPDGRLRVDPGSPDASYLINKITGVGMCRGNRMPLREAALPAADIDLIRSWICAGAPNN